MSEYDLERFIEAQNPVYASVVDELRAGEKRGHWMWFVFPQLRGLGQSAAAEKYGIVSRGEAESYAAHELLGSRLRECTRLVIGLKNRSAEQIFAYPDALKFRSCMTLFSVVSKDAGYSRDAIFKYFGGVSDERTIAILNRESTPGWRAGRRAG